MRVNRVFHCSVAPNRWRAGAILPCACATVACRSLYDTPPPTHTITRLLCVMRSPLDGARALPPSIELAVVMANYSWRKPRTGTVVQPSFPFTFCGCPAVATRGTLLPLCRYTHTCRGGTHAHKSSSIVAGAAAWVCCPAAWVCCLAQCGRWCTAAHTRHACTACAANVTPPRQTTHRFNAPRRCVAGPSGCPDPTPECWQGMCTRTWSLIARRRRRAAVLNT